ncbi:L,D-transpeptidase [Streptacidiphilus jiangxiensis]|uniref:Lipoprotein-anchoring transpeptidase ErfK/SrfK n=1 Tax=Streptacidiphilus jiangxiensis TaxID=235985 RepID=A0A1H7ZT73_STRJI|nr:L,D-transpeptidase [Streptacidiphilus jiangxiensis]SEM60994.1 Lipoprotein-anchoring transpeptidase ErfK/SrfK [Streptacidiphilus jiangxiensis]
MRRIKRNVGVALLAGAMLAGAGLYGGTAMAAGTGANVAHTAAPMLLDSITPVSGSTVGVAMPISVVFTDAVAPAARAAIERHLKVTTSVPVLGAWHWFGDRRVDWRPKGYWPVGTKVTLDAQLTGVADGHGRVGVHGYKHTFTIGSDFETFVSVPGHTMKITHNGRVVRTMPIDAGSKTFPSWDGTMAVIDKQPEVRMTSCSVGISCNPSDPNYYDITLPWDVHLTFSGTYVHYSTGDPNPGHSAGSHGCVHLSLANSKWYYNAVKQGDPVTITGSPRGKAAGDNGYADYDLSWAQWLAGSATGAHTA